MTTGETASLFSANVPFSDARYSDALEIVGLDPTVKSVVCPDVPADDVAPAAEVLVVVELEPHPTTAQHNSALDRAKRNLVAIIEVLSS
jgi:hypothetical protein